MTSFTRVQRIVSRNVSDSTLRTQLHDNKFITALYLSQLAYFKFTTISHKLSEFGAKKISLYNEKGTQGYLAELDDMVIVAFRGTELSRKEDLRNILTFWKHPYLDVTAHKGFVTSLERLIADVEGDLSRVDPSKRKVYVGHSMGGALSTLLALSHRPDELCTFGAPRVSSRDIEARLEGIEYTRIVTKWDWIRKLPPNIPWILPYHHVGKPYVLPTKWNWKSVTYPHMLGTYLNSLLNDEEIIKTTDNLEAKPKDE